VTDAAIRSEGLGKRYRLGGRRARYRALRDVIADTVAAPFRRIRSKGRPAAAANHSSGEDEFIWALRDVSFEVKHGEAVGFIGKAFRRSDSERVARLAVEKLALLAAAAALNAVSPRHAELFAATRLAGNHASMYGAVDLASADVTALLERALP